MQWCGDQSQLHRGTYIASVRGDSARGSQSRRQVPRQNLHAIKAKPHHDHGARTPATHFAVNGNTAIMRPAGRANKASGRQRKASGSAFNRVIARLVALHLTQPTTDLFPHWPRQFSGGNRNSENTRRKFSATKTPSPTQPMCQLARRCPASRRRVSRREEIFFDPRRHSSPCLEHRYLDPRGC